MNSAISSCVNGSLTRVPSLVCCPLTEKSSRSLANFSGAEAERPRLRSCSQATWYRGSHPATVWRFPQGAAVRKEALATRGPLPRLDSLRVRSSKKMRKGRVPGRIKSRKAPAQRRQRQRVARRRSGRARLAECRTYVTETHYEL